MASNRFHGRTPKLKSSVDVQLQSAFSDHNWAQVIRLADKRARALKEPYYEAIKIAAETRLDNSAPTCAALVAANQLVKDKSTPELETVELYEWACQDVGSDLNYAETFGALRSRWVKANPKKPQVLQCLRACIEQKDLHNAQQIAAALDKVYAHSDDDDSRYYMAWNMILTFLLSVNTNRSEKERQMFSMLALRQLKRAAEATEAAVDVEKVDRGLNREEDVYLYYHVVRTHGTKSDFKEMISKPRTGALNQFKKGRQLLFDFTLKTLEQWHEWSLLFDLCSQALSYRDENGELSFQAVTLAADRRVWDKFIAAASRLADSQTSLHEIQRMLDRFNSTKGDGEAMLRKTISLALMEVAFRMPHTKRNAQNQGFAPRLIHLAMFLRKYSDRLSTFDDIRQYVEDLSFTDMKTLTEEVLPEILNDIVGKPNKVVFQALECKISYLLTTCGQTISSARGLEVDGSTQATGSRCRFCTELVETATCKVCLRKLAVRAIQLYNQFKDDAELLSAVDGLNKDPRVDLALVVGTCLLKLAGVRNRIAGDVEHAAKNVDMPLLLSAILILDKQLKETPGEAPLRLLLIQLYLMIGCASYAYQLWGPMGVKRTIHDSLSPVLFDRLSTVSPGLFHGSQSLMEPMLSYYQRCLSEKAPLRIWDAFTGGNYSSILNMMEFRDKLERSCTMVMAVLEDRRTARMFGGKLECEIRDVPLVAHITDSTRLVNVTDYGSFPDFENGRGLPIQDFVRLGPGLSNERSHLGLLAEEFLDVIAFKPNRSFKPTKPHEVAYKDHDYIVETLGRLHSSLDDFLYRTDAVPFLTGPEMAYYKTVSLLCSALIATLGTCPSSAPEDLSALSLSITSSLAGQYMAVEAYRVNNAEAAGLPMADVLFALTDMHSLSYMRDTALAVLQATAFALALHEKKSAGTAAAAAGNNSNGKAGDSSDGFAMHATAVADMKALERAATSVIADVRAHGKALKERLAAPGWLDMVLDWTFGAREGTEQEREQGKDNAGADELARAMTEMVGGRAGAEEWAGKVLESWREGVKGWGMVKMEL